MKDQDSQGVSIWTIAGGILMALLVWRAINVWQYNREMRALNEQIATWARQAPKPRQPTPVTYRAPEAPPKTTTDPRDVPLADDERCIDGQRFRRLPNGWEQSGVCRR